MNPSPHQLTAMFCVFLLYIIGLMPRTNRIIKNAEGGLYKVEMAFWFLGILNFLSRKNPKIEHKGVNMNPINRIPVYKTNNIFPIYRIVKND